MQKNSTRKGLAAIYRQEIIQDVTLFTFQSATKFYDKLFTELDFTLPGAARRGGLSATFDELNKFFTISGMPVVSGQYWNSVHGTAPGEAVQDLEGMQSMRTLARNMTFLMRGIALAKAQYGLPEKEPAQRTNFIR